MAGEEHGFLFENNPHPMWIYDTEDLQLLDVNEAAIRHYGYSREEFQRMTIRDVRPGDQLPFLSEALSKVPRGGLHFPGIFKHRKKDGTIIDVELTSFRFIHKDRAAALVLINDITERVRMEEALKASEMRFRSLVESTSDWLWEVDANARYTYASPKIRDLLGYEPEEVIGRTPFDFMLPEEAEQVAADFEAIRRERRPFAALVNTNLHKDGRPVILETSGVPVFGANGILLGYRGIDRDITERKRMEEALRESEARYRNLIETAEEGVWAIDIEDRTTFVNSKMAQLLGYSAEEMRGRTPWEFMDEEMRRISLRNHELHRFDRRQQHDCRYLRKDGAAVWCIINVSPILDKDDRYAGSLAMVNDITERRQIEETLRQAQKMEAVGQLAGGVAHDFNNCLTAITGYAELLNQPCGMSVQTLSEKVKASAQRAAKLTQQLLAFSRKQVLEPKVLDLGALLSGTADMLKRLLGEDIELVIDAEKNAGKVKADPSQLEEVLINTASNARDAMPRGGRLTLKVERAHPTELSRRLLNAAACVQLTITDTGIGMDPDTQARIFEPFFTTKEKGKGTGLGLSSVYGIVKQSGGHIFVESSPGIGTTLTIYLPESSQDDARTNGSARIRGSSQQRTDGRFTILLVEDDAGVRECTRKLLSQAGHVVMEASNGLGAVKLAGTHPSRIDLLITDVVLPGSSGPESAARIVAHHPEARVLYISGFAESKLLQHNVSASQHGFLRKPFTWDELQQKLDSVLATPQH